MTEPSNLRDAAEVTVTEADQSAAEAWLNANNGEWIDALNLAEAFARHREQSERETVERIVDYLTAISDPGSTFQDRRLAYQLAAAAFAVSIEAGEWKQ